MNIFGTSFNQMIRFSGSRREGDNENGGNIIESVKLREKKLEMKIREAEDKRMEYLRGRILKVEESDLDYDTKKIKIASLTQQIEQIEENRAKREAEAAQRQIEQAQTEEEKRRVKQERKRPADEETQDEEEYGHVTISKDEMGALVKLSLSKDSIHRFNQVKASMSAEANQLKLDIKNSFSVTKYGAVPDGHAKPDDFRNTQLKKLTKGIYGIDAAISSNLRKMNRAAAALAEKNTRKTEDTEAPYFKETEERPEEA